MRELSSAAFLVTVVGIICSFLPTTSAKKVQQVGEDPRTFVVRYKNGDQTVPVTVVLDYKKQTEYVINMHPRTPAKSVTLYDFKQRTIAYKDLTNRECFLGRLTYETLKEETDALNKIKNPVDHKPKLLTLDPQRAALTPTEIRNIAGQRTAVFCRKMNTWLVKPQDSHNIRKRETQDEEVEERTFHRHGYHTVRYSHYGKETRRIRNSRRNGSKKSLYDHKNTSNNTSQKPGTSDENSFFGESIPPFQTLHHSLQPPSIEDPHFPTSNVISQQDSGIPGVPDPSLLHNSILPNTNDVPSEFRYPHSGNTDDSHQHRITERTPNQHRYPLPPLNFDAVLGREGPSVSNNEAPSDSLYSRSPVFTEEPTNQHESSFQNPAPYEFNGRAPERSKYVSANDLPDSSPDNGDSQIESEWSPNGTSPHYIPIGEYPQIPNTLIEVPEDPDVSTNFLEVQRNHNKFENIDRGAVLPQSNEDVHDLFEGFYNLRHQGGRGSENVNPPNALVQGGRYEPHSSPGTNHYPSFTHSDVHPVENIQSPPLGRDINRTRLDEYWRGGHVLPYTSTDAATTDASTLRYEPPTTTTLPQVLPHRRRYEDLNSVSHFGAPIRNGNGRPTFAPKAHYEPPHSTEQPYHHTTAPPSIHFAAAQNGNQRSDIPSEVEENVGGANSPLSVRRNYSRPFLTSRDSGGLYHNHHQAAPDPLSGYKPDDIVINLDELSTQRSLVAGFRGRGITALTDPPKRKHPTATERRGEQVSGGTWRGSPNPRHPRPVLHSRPHLQRPPYRQPQLPNRRVHIEPPQYTFDHPPYPLDALPPGVSIHPRHPQAPYADMFQSNVPPPLPQESPFATKVHRQRHFRKKAGCCRSNNGNCCRNGGSCCNGKAPRTPCCSNRGHQVIPPQRHLPVNFPQAEIVAPGDNRHLYRGEENTPAFQQDQQRPLNDGRSRLHDSFKPPRKTLEEERCLKEKMCRTVYESTQKVIVCRNVNIAGCS